MATITNEQDARRPGEKVADPRRVLSATWLSKDEKRELLAFWISDIHAVPDNPALRQLRSGTFLHVDDLSLALKALDEPALLSSPNVVQFPHHRSTADDPDDPDHPAPLASRLRPSPPPVVTDARASAAARSSRRGLR